MGAKYNGSILGLQQINELGPFHQIMIPLITRKDYMVMRGYIAYLPKPEIQLPFLNAQADL